MGTNKVAIGIDPSLTGTAVCCYDPTQVTQSHTERFTSKPAKGLQARLRRYRGLLDGIMDVCADADPQIILLEGYSYGSKGAAVLDMAEFGGLLRHELLRRFTSMILEVPPTSLKKWATGKGNAKKVQVVTALVKRYGCEYATDDEYDAFALARMAAQVIGWDEPVTINQKAVIEKLVIPH